MPGPAYDPAPWNELESIASNNCYNYATNQSFKPNAQGFPAPSEPGRSQGVGVGVVVGFDPGLPGISLNPNGSVVVLQPAIQVSCESIKAAGSLDGLAEPVEGKCPAECWQIAYCCKAAVKSPHPSGLIWTSGDYHFVRQDADGGWSHKPGISEATRSRWNGKSGADGAFDGPPITDPAKDNVGPGFVFCGYLCVCPNKVKVALRDVPDHGRGNAAAWLYRPGSPSAGLGALAVLEGTTFPALLESWREAARASWKSGSGPGTPRHRLDVGAVRPSPAATILVSAESVTLWQGAPRHFLDRTGFVAGRLDAWLAVPPAHHSGVPPRPARPRPMKAKGGTGDPKR